MQFQRKKRETRTFSLSVPTFILKLNAIKISLTFKIKHHFNVYYRVFLTFIIDGLLVHGLIRHLLYWLFRAETMSYSIIVSPVPDLQ